jgi:hypothetical protein
MNSDNDERVQAATVFGYMRLEKLLNVARVTSW